MDANVMDEAAKPLKNRRYEAMCQIMANQELSQEQAAKEVGFAGAKSNGSRIANLPEFQARLELLRTRKAEKAEKFAALASAVTTESLIAECEEARVMAIELKQPQSILAAIKEKGVLSGKRIERSEQGEPGEFDGLNEEQLAEYIGQKMAELGIEIISDDKLDQANDGTRH